MTIEELNKLIKEELDAYLGEDDDIEVTTDEPGVETGEEALDILRQIFDLIKPTVEPEAEPEEEDEPADEEPADEEEPAEEEEGDPEPEEEEPVDEAVGYANYTADQVSKVKADADDVNKGLNESVARFKKLANIKG